MAACATSKPTSSGKSPPTSAESESLPSENAPAPENPAVMRHGSQPTHAPEGPRSCLGQRRSRTDSPLSTMTMCPACPCSSSDSAQNMPAGPMPTMTTSVSPAPMSALPCLVASLRAGLPALSVAPGTAPEQPRRRRCRHCSACRRQQAAQDACCKEDEKKEGGDGRQRRASRRGSGARGNGARGAGRRPLRRRSSPSPGCGQDARARAGSRRGSGRPASRPALRRGKRPRRWPTCTTRARGSRPGAP